MVAVGSGNPCGFFSFLFLFFTLPAPPGPYSSTRLPAISARKEGLVRYSKIPFQKPNFKPYDNRYIQDCHPFHEKRGPTFRLPGSYLTIHRAPGRLGTTIHKVSERLHAKSSGCSMNYQAWCIYERLYEIYPCFPVLMARDEYR